MGYEEAKAYYKEWKMVEDERNELIAYIGVLEAFVSQYKPGPMLLDQRPECLADVLPTPNNDGEW